MAGLSCGTCTDGSYLMRQPASCSRQIEVDVLAIPQRGIEDVARPVACAAALCPAGRHGVERSAADEQRRCRHVPDPAGRNDARCLIAEVKAAARLLISARPRSAAPA